MKKHLLLWAISALIGVMSHAQNVSLVPTGTIGTATPVEALESGHVYFIYNATTADNNNRYGFRYENKGHVLCNHVTPQNVNALTANHAWKANETSDGVWTFQNVATGAWMCGATEHVSTSNIEYLSGKFVLEAIEGSTTQFKVSINGSTWRWDGVAGENSPMVLWNGANDPIHPYEFYEVSVANGNAEEGIAVTLNFMMPDGTSASVQKYARSGQSIETKVPFISNFFNATGVVESDKTVSTTNSTFTVNGTWNLLTDRVGRLRFRDTKQFIKYNGGSTDRTDFPTNDDTDVDKLDPKRMFYFKYHGFNNNRPVISIHSIFADDAYGISMQRDDNTKTALSQTPDQFEVISVMDNDNRFILLKKGTLYDVAHDYGNGLSYWFSYGYNDAGSFCYFQELTDDYFDSVTENTYSVSGNTYTLDPTKKSQAKTTHSVADVRALYSNDVTYKFPSVLGMDVAPVYQIFQTVDKLTRVPTLDGFTKTGATENPDGSVNVTGTWQTALANFDINKAYRFTINSKEYLRHESNSSIKCNVTENKNEFQPEHLWYFKAVGFEGGYPTVTLHSLAGDDNMGVHTAGTEGDALSYSSDITVFNVRPSDTGFALETKGSNGGYLNDYAGNNVVKIWVSASNKGGTGSRMYAIELSDSDFDNNNSWTYNNSEVEFESDIKARAKASHSVTDLKALFAKPTPLSTTIKQGNAFAALNIAPEEAREAWKNASKTTLAEATSAFEALVAATINTSGAFVNIRHAGVHPTHYINIDNDGVCVHSADEGKRAIKLIPAFNNDGGQIGFYMHNEYTNKYFKMPKDNNTTQEMVASQDNATVYTLELFNGEKGSVKVKDVNATTEESKYLHANQSTTVMHWNATHENSSWYIDQCSIDEATNEYLNGAMAASANASADDVTGFYSVDTDAVNAARAMEVNSTAEKRTKGDAIYEALATQRLNMPTSGKVYTIRCTDTANSRGNLQYAEGLETIATSGRNGVAYNAEDAKQQWAIYKDADGKMYLYNLGARLFANIYYERPNHNGGATNEDFCWRFSKVPTEITEFNLDHMTFNATEGHGFNIYAAEGKNTTSGRHAGMFVVNGITEAPVPASAGFGATDNGIGFWLTEVGTVSEELQAEMKAAFEAASAEVSAAKAAYEAVSATAANEDVIGHYTDAGFRAYTAAGTAATAAADNDTKHFHYVKGLAAERVSLEHEAVYTLQTSENKHYAVINGKLEYTAEDAKNGENTHFWQANVTNGIVSFTHDYDPNTEPNGTLQHVTVALEHNGATLFTVAHGAPGVVTLVPVATESETPAAKPGMRMAEGENAPLTFVITKAPDGSNATTTSIAEVESWSERSELIYDLQGRRLAAPARGINIIGGRKVLVK